MTLSVWTEGVAMENRYLRRQAAIWEVVIRHKVVHIVHLLLRNSVSKVLFVQRVMVVQSWPEKTHHFYS